MLKKLILIISLLLVPFLTHPVKAAVDCDTVAAYFNELPKKHFSLTEEAMTNLAYRSAYEMVVSELKPADQLKKMEMFARLETAGNDYKKLCEALSALYLASRSKEASGDHAEEPAEEPYDELSEFIENYLRKTIKAIDLHTSYLTEKNFKKFQNSLRNEFKGIGIDFSPTGEKGKGPFLIKNVLPVSPAIKRGLQVDDVILKANQEDCGSLTTAEFVEWISKQKGTFSLEISRGGKAVTISGLEVTSFFEPSVRSHFINDKGLVYIQISHFTQFTSIELNSHLEHLKSAYRSDLKGILLDLRNNPGGSLRGAVETADLFLNQGPTCTAYRRNHEKSFEANAMTGIATDAPLFILINANSASASEIVASTLQDHGRAIVLGERSFGKGTVLSQLTQRGADLETSAVYYTDSVFYRPTGETVQRHGVIPDIEIVDAEFQRRLEELKEELRKEGEGKIVLCRESDYEGALVAEPKPMPFQPTSSCRTLACQKLLNRLRPTEYSEIEKKDLQLTKAIEYLKLFTDIPITMTHFGIARYYQTPEHRLYITTDLYQKGGVPLLIHIQIFEKEKKLLYETKALLSGNELTLPIKDTAVEKFVEEKTVLKNLASGGLEPPPGTILAAWLASERAGSFLLKIEVLADGVMHTHQTIVVF